MDTTERMKLSDFAKLNGISYKTAHRLWEAGEIKGIKLKTTNTILVEGWQNNDIQTPQ